MTPPALGSVSRVDARFSSPSISGGQDLSRVKTGVPPGGEQKSPPASQGASGDKYLEALGGLPNDGGDTATALNQSAKNFCPSCQQAAELGGQESMARTMSQLETLRNQVQQEETLAAKFQFSSQEQAEPPAQRQQPQLSTSKQQPSPKNSESTAFQRGQEQVSARENQFLQRQSSASGRAENNGTSTKQSTQESFFEVKKNFSEAAFRGETKNLPSRSELVSGGFTERLISAGLLARHSFAQAAFSNSNLGTHGLNLDFLKFSFLSFLRSGEPSSAKTMNFHDVFYQLSKEFGSPSSKRILLDASMKPTLTAWSNPTGAFVGKTQGVWVSSKEAGGMFSNFIKNLFTPKLWFKPLPQKALAKTQDGAFLSSPMAALAAPVRTSGKDPRAALSWLENWIKKILPGQVSISVAEMNEAEIRFWMAFWKKMRKKRKSSSWEDDFEDLEEILAELSQSHFIPSVLKREILARHG